MDNGEGGIEIAGADPLGPAYQSGLREGDQLLAIDNVPVTSLYPVSYTHLDVYKRQIPDFPSVIALAPYRGILWNLSGCRRWPDFLIYQLIAIFLKGALSFVLLQR